MSGAVHSSIVCHIQPFYKFPATQNRQASFLPPLKQSLSSLDASAYKVLIDKATNFLYKIT